MKRTERDFDSEEKKKKKLDIWEKIPNDVKTHVFTFIDKKDQFNFSLASKKDRDFSEDFFKWKIEKYIPHFRLNKDLKLSYKYLYHSIILPLAHGHNISLQVRQGPYEGMYPLHVYVALFKKNQFLIERNPIGQINQTDKYGAVPLCYALQTRNGEGARWLLENNADINIVSNLDVAINLEEHFPAVKLFRGANMLHYVALSGEVEIARLLFESNRTAVENMLLRKTALGLMPIHFACKSQNPQMILFLIKQLGEQESLYTEISKVRLNISKMTNDADTIFKTMKLCIEQDEISPLKKMLQISWMKDHINYGDTGEVDDYYNFNEEYLHGLAYQCITKNRPQILDFLLSNGMLIDTNVNNGERIFEFAIANKHNDCVGVLIKHMPFLSRSKEKEGMYMLHRACEFNLEEDVECLLVEGDVPFINLGERDDFETPLMCLVNSWDDKKISICNLKNKFPDEWENILGNLLDNNIIEKSPDSVNRENFFLKKEYLNAAKKINLDKRIIEAIQVSTSEYIFSLLIAKGADLNLQNSSGKTVLHYAIQKDTWLLCELFKRGCDPKRGDLFYSTDDLKIILNMLKAYLRYKYPEDNQKNLLHIAVEVYNDPHKLSENQEIISAIISGERFSKMSQFFSFPKMEERFSDINKKDANDETPIFAAIRAENMVAVAILIEKKAELLEYAGVLVPLLQEKYPNGGPIVDMVMAQLIEEGFQPDQPMDYGDYKENEEEQELMRQERWSP